MNKTELKIKVTKMKKNHPRNEVYDYLIAQVFCNAKTSISVALIQNMTGLRITDIAMMNKLLYYWTYLLTDAERIQKAVNILMYVNNNVK